MRLNPSLLTVLVVGSALFRAEPALASPWSGTRTVPCRDQLTADSTTSRQEVARLEQIDFSMTQLFSFEELEALNQFDTLKDVIAVKKMKMNLLITALVGGVNSGKTTMSRAIDGIVQGVLMRRNVRPLTTSLRGGQTQRIVVSTAKQLTPEVLSNLQARLGALTPMDESAGADLSLTPGPGLVIERPGLPASFVVVDTPGWDSTPENIATAFRAINSADVLFVLFTETGIGNTHVIQTLQKIFAQCGPKKIILILRTFASANRMEVRQLLLELTEKVLKRPVDPDSVLGMYVMPISEGVFHNLENPELVPLEGSPEFANLIEWMNANAVSLRDESLRTRQATALAFLEQYVRERRIKAQWAQKIYGLGLKVMIESAARTHRQAFPYGAVVTHIRAAFQKYRSTFDQKLHSVAAVIGSPWEFLRKLTPAALQQSALEVALKEDHQVHDHLAVTQLLRQMHEGIVSVSNSQRDSESFRDLEVYLRQFYKLFEEELGPEVVLEQNRLSLPSLQLLPPAAQRAWQQVLRWDAQKLAEHLGSQISDARLADPPDVSNAPEIEALVQNTASPSARPLTTPWLRNLMLRTLDLTTVGVTLMGAGTLLYQNFSPLWTLIMIAPAYSLNRTQQNMTDRILRRQLNDWFFKLQYKVTSLFFEDLVSELSQKLSQYPPNQDDHLKSIQDAFHDLNPKSKPIPTSPF